MKKKNTPFIHKFKTEKCNYVYDVNTSQILCVDPVIYDIIDKIGSKSLAEIFNKFKNKHTKEQIQTAFNEIMDAYRQYGLFSGQRPSSIGIPHDKNKVKQSVDNYLRGVILGVTEACNLRCKYCVYTVGIEGRRSHSAKNMDFDVARRAIDYLAEHSKEQEEPLTVGFYGGEPLIAFDLIKKCVAYAKKRLKGRSYLFTITTNATLWDEEKIDFLAKNNFGITISLDGPEEIHNKYRIDKSGEGSFEKVISNIRRLQEKYPTYFKIMVYFNCVMVPPLNIRALDSFFSSIGRPTRVSLVDTWGVEDSELNTIDWRVEGTKEIFNKFKKDALAGNYEKKRRHEVDRFPYDFCIGTLSRIKKRLIFESPRDKVIKNTLCTPGASRLFVSPLGKFYTCERVEGNENMCIGDVWTGVDAEKSFKLMNEFHKINEKDCCNCWLVNICHMCFSYIVHNNEYDNNKRKYHCSLLKEGYHRMLEMYCSLLEEDKDSLGFIEEEEVEEILTSEIKEKIGVYSND